MPAPLVNAKATMQCTFGTAPSRLTVLPSPQVLVEGVPLATVNDSVAVANIAPFGMCMSLANPAVASATATAQGVLTPQPCVPQTVSWVPGVPTLLVGGKPAVNATCTCTCGFGGAISITMPGTTQTLG